MDDAMKNFWEILADKGIPRTLVCNGASELTLNKNKQLSTKKGVSIEFSFSAHYTPEDNGRVERN